MVKLAKVTAARLFVLLVVLAGLAMMLEASGVTWQWVASRIR